MHLTRLWYLKNIDIFKSIREEEFKRLPYFSSVSRVGRYENIGFPEHAPEGVYLIQEGHVKLSRLDENGRESTLDILCPGEVFGELEACVDKSPNEFATAINNVVLCSVTKKGCEQLLTHIPNLDFGLTKQIGFRQHEFRVRVTDLLGTSVEQRVLKILLRYSGDHGKILNGLLTIDDPPTDLEISRLVGTSPEAVTMVLNDLQRARFIGITQDSLTILQLAKLSDLLDRS